MSDPNLPLSGYGVCYMDANKAAELGTEVAEMAVRATRSFETRFVSDSSLEQTLLCFLASTCQYHGMTTCLSEKAAARTNHPRAQHRVHPTKDRKRLACTEMSHRSNAKDTEAFRL